VPGRRGGRSQVVRQPRTAFGGRLSGDTSRVSLALIGLNLAIFVLGLLVGQVELRLRFANVAGPLLLEPGELAGVATASTTDGDRRPSCTPGCCTWR
jgi:hypothetical protein